MDASLIQSPKQDLIQPERFQLSYVIPCLQFIFQNASPTPESVIATIDEYCYTENWMMHIGDDKGNIITEIVKKHAPKTFLDLGTYMGYSAIKFGAILREIHGSAARVFTFECDPVYSKISRQVIEFAGLSEVITVFTGNFHDNVGLLPVSKVDFVFIDHWEEFYVRDLQLILDKRLLEEGSVVVADNMLWSLSCS